MTEQEKELALLLNSFRPTHREKWLDEELLSAARALIQTYPQILAEKVWEGDVGLVSVNAKSVYQTEFFDIPTKEYKNHLKKVQIFIREVVS